MEKNEVKCRISTVKKIAEDVLLIDIENKQSFELEDYHEVKRAVLKLGEGSSFYNIIKLEENTLPTKDVREASSSVEGSYYKKADAFIVSSLAQKIMGNVMMRINKPIVPTKFFNSIDDAHQWLNELKESKFIDSRSGELTTLL
ncbi:MAG: hypothetical protein HUJ25_05400 [Crocinitomicaceae bacterium]|nr:hypothetical protein [Crocinitomicaceae bacterium]